MKKLFKLSGNKVIASLKVKSDKIVKGFEEREVEKGEDGLLYLPGKAPALSEEKHKKRYIKKAKMERAELVSKIIVEVDGMQFDGDESSQDRMTRAIVALDAGETILWVLADNSIVQVTREQLKRALRLAGLLLTEVWANPYK